MHMSTEKERRSQYYVVCLLDLLAQRDKLRRWRQVSPSREEQTEADQAIADTAGAVERFQEFFQVFFQGADACTRPSQIAALPAQKQQMYTRWKSCELRTQQFGDTFVFYSPVLNPYGDLSVIATYAMIGACCASMSEALAHKTPFRGAVTMGRGVELEHHVIYGPALVEAYDLERNVAKYPRVVISPSVLELIAGKHNYSEEHEIAQGMMELAKVCRSFIWQDVDGSWAVDFLGNGAWDVLKRVQGMRDRVEHAYTFVRCEAERFREVGDSKLALRYYLLQQYIESRLPIWGIKDKRNEA
jgi:hypothetical protein